MTYKIEGRVSKKTKTKFDDMYFELAELLRKRLHRRILFDDVANLIIETYQNYDYNFKEVATAKPSFR